MSVLPVSDPARCVTELALCRLCRLAELRRLESSVLEDCLVRCRPTPRPWWKRPSASTSWSDRRCIDEDIIGPAWPPVWPLEFNGPWWSICKKMLQKALAYEENDYLLIIFSCVFLPLEGSLNTKILLCFTKFLESCFGYISCWYDAWKNKLSKLCLRVNS